MSRYDIKLVFYPKELFSTCSITLEGIFSSIVEIAQFLNLREIKNAPV